ncbi:uncharacterized protein LOC131151614 [Malania oleifera]|uniref:uncharacterized protein LOC131151614 n=1 Tax=Malania oleifera TaxID=397392 RepID=UPI0025ADA31C|nr:uncharacterized protein LOC131151614 [Malania oleifera]XP_057958866.1 uncharacterized protein LOC131151614 [Malania oleifera]
MGSIVSKTKSNPCEKDLNGLTQKIRALQKEISEMMCRRERESRASERDAMAFAKEGEWKRERKRLREEVRRLRKMLEEREERIRGMEDEMMGEKTEKEWQLLGTSLLVEQMEEEKARRDEAVEKWKRLYLAIKTELDDLIQRTHQGDILYWRAEEEDLMDELQRELKAKEETIKFLQAQLASSKLEESKKDREVDILRQSLRIMSSKKKTANIATSLSKTLHL